MKRFTCIFFAMLVMLYATGCAKTKEGVEQLWTVYNTVGAAETTVEGVRQIIDWQITDSQKSINEMEGSDASDQDTSSPSNSEADLAENQQKASELQGYIDEIDGYMATIGGLSKTGIKQVDMTIDAAGQYFASLKTALSDLMSIFTFYFDYEEATLPLNQFETDNANETDYLTYIENLWNALDQTSQNMQAVNCPTFMSQTNQLFISQIDNYKTMMETLYKAAYLGDTLSYYSAQNMGSRIDIQMNKYALRLTEDFNMQYQKVSVRLDTSIGTLKGELINNCRTLLQAMGEEVA